jgi:hypothetical protein
MIDTFALPAGHASQPPSSRFHDRQDVRAHVERRYDPWRIHTIGESVTEDGQPFLTVTLVRVTTDVADWANTVPNGLLEQTPSLLPCQCR